jgi:hypothetical protein
MDARGQALFVAGMVIMVVGIFAFSGLVELVLAVGGVLIASQGRRYRKT